jgi:hypothetical protein
MRWLIIPLLFLSSFAKAQIHFPDSSAYWQEYCSSGAWGEPSPVGEQFFFLGHDSLFESVVHRTLHLGDFNQWGGFDTLGSEIVGIIRVEDEQVFYNGKILSDDNVIGINDDDTISVLLYDFSLLANDTVHHYSTTNLNSGDITSYFSVVFEDPDTVLINGLNIKRIWVQQIIETTNSGQVLNSEQYSDGYWFQGIGSENGFFGPLEVLGESGCILNCFKSFEDSFEYCNGLTIDETENNSQHCLTYSYDQIISSCVSSNSVISVYDMTGKLVQTESYTVEGFDCASLKKGIYLALFQSETERSALKFAISR